MLGKINPKHREVTVVGAGIAGLLIADALDRSGYVVTLLEASDRAGGLISTRRMEHGIAESAAHSLLATPDVVELCKDLDVPLVPVNRNSKARFIWRGGKLRRFPLSISEVLAAFFRAYFVLADRSLAPEQVTLEQWAKRFLGEAPLRYLMTPFVRGIYGARPSEINVEMAFPALTVPRGHSLLSMVLGGWFRRFLKRSRVSKRARMMTPQEGMGAITQALESRLTSRLGERFKRGIKIEKLPEASNLVLSLPAHEAGELLVGVDPALGRALCGIRYTPLVSVTVFSEKSAFAKLPQGVGVLLPEGTSRKSLGVLFNSSSFPGRVTDEARFVSLTVMLGGTSEPKIAQASDDELRSLVRSELEALFGLSSNGLLEMVIHRRERAVPQYNEHLREAWNRAAHGWCSQPGHILFGNYTGQVSIRGMIEEVTAEKISRPVTD